MKIQLSHKFEDIISVDNLLEAWREFIKGKRRKKDMQKFSFRLIDNIFELYHDLRYHTYQHGLYQAFSIHDPKPRSIHKATVRDRLLHRAIYRILYPFFARIFIADSYSCQIGKGTHRALNRFKDFAYKVSKNNTKTCWILKCDIKKFFASIDQGTLLGNLGQYIQDRDILWLLNRVIKSFSSIAPGRGLPLGNLTSQLLVNIYMNEFDQFVKHRLKVKYYIRYADDFVIFSDDYEPLKRQIYPIRQFLKDKLNLELHPKKVFIRTLASGVDFLGWAHFPNHRILRTSTKRRMIKRMKATGSESTRQSYLGLLKHGNTYKIRSLYFHQ